MITSGLTANLCVAAMLIFQPIKRTFKDTTGKGISKQECDKQTEPKSLLQQMKSLSSNQNYQFLWLNGFSIYCGFFMAYSHVAAYTQYHGASPYIAGAILSTMGFCNLAGRLALPLLSQHPTVNAIFIHTISSLLLGMSKLPSIGWKRTVPYLKSGLHRVPMLGGEVNHQNPMKEIPYNSLFCSNPA